METVADAAEVTDEPAEIHGVVGTKRTVGLVERSMSTNVIRGNEDVARLALVAATA